MKIKPRLATLILFALCATAIRVQAETTALAEGWRQRDD
jgi:hypothetical protein